MFEHLRADDATISARQDLAKRVRVALGYAGVRALAGDRLPVEGGALVEVDEASDRAGGVYVRWTPSPEFSKVVRDSLMAGHRDGPVFDLYGSISLSMRNALTEVLRHSGFRVDPVDDAGGEPTILVLGSRSGTQDPLA
jgi:hypothetical protein